MRRYVLIFCLLFAIAVPLSLSGASQRGYAQIFGPQGDEFKNGGFAAPFQVRCGLNPFPQACPDPSGVGTWSLNTESPDNLRIWTQRGTLVGPSNDARNFVLQRVDSGANYTITTKVAFPGSLVGSASQLGQTAGLMVYQSDDNFLFLGRTYPPTTGGSQTSQLEFVQEVNGIDTVSAFTENSNLTFNTTVYLQLRKSGSVYQAFYSYSGSPYVPFPQSATATPTGTLTPSATGTSTTTPVTDTPTAGTPVAYNASYPSPQVGLFAWGGPDSQVATNALPADFDWFRSGDPATPAPTALATSTNTSVPFTASATATSTATSTNTVVPSTATATSTQTPTPTNTVAPTRTPRPTAVPRPPVSRVRIKYVQVWYHVVRSGTFNHIEMQATNPGVYGIWSHVIFATGLHLDFYEQTDRNGHWKKQFPVPVDTISPYSHQAVVTFQLIRNKKYNKSFATFSVVR